MGCQVKHISRPSKQPLDHKALTKTSFFRRTAKIFTVPVFPVSFKYSLAMIAAPTVPAARALCPQAWPYFFLQWDTALFLLLSGSYLAAHHTLPEYRSLVFRFRRFQQKQFSYRRCPLYCKTFFFQKLFQICSTVVHLKTIFCHIKNRMLDPGDLFCLFSAISWILLVSYICIFLSFFIMVLSDCHRIFLRPTIPASSFRPGSGPLFSVKWRFASTVTFQP